LAGSPDLTSGKGDVTLLELLDDNAAYDAKLILSGNELPSFRKAINERTSAEGEVWEDSLDVHYYLSQGRPFHAFHRMLYGIKEALSSPLLAPYLLSEALPVSFFTRPLRERMPGGEGVIPIFPDEVCPTFPPSEYGY